jgi:hypothetical protein
MLFLVIGQSLPLTRAADSLHDRQQKPPGKEVYCPVKKPRCCAVFLYLLSERPAVKQSEPRKAYYERRGQHIKRPLK